MLFLLVVLGGGISLVSVTTSMPFYGYPDLVELLGRLASIWACRIVALGSIHIHGNSVNSSNV